MYYYPEGEFSEDDVYDDNYNDDRFYEDDYLEWIKYQEFLETSVDFEEEDFDE